MQQMTPNDEKTGYAKTSLTMTRAMSEKIGLKVRKVLEDATEDKLEKSYIEWQEFISQCWSDPIWIRAVNVAISRAATDQLDLNHNGAFIQLILEKTFPELKLEMEKTHPIAKMALKDNIDKESLKPMPKHQYKDVWLTPEERQRLFKQQQEEYQ